jgi:Ca-activated chloride channel family protein
MTILKWRSPEVDLRRLRVVPAVGVAALLFLSACQASATAEPSASESAVSSASGAPSQAAGASNTPRPEGPATVEGPAEVGAGDQFEVSWTGPAATGDYITIVPAGATAWAGEDYFDVSEGSPSTLQASVEDGAYALWYVANDDNDTILARVAIRVTPFEGSVDGPASVGTGDTFEVSWTGPGSPGDYITIVPPGTTAWNGQDYFDVSVGNTGELQAPDAAGNYELWYVSGQEEVFMVSTPIQVTP